MSQTTQPSGYSPSPCHVRRRRFLLPFGAVTTWYGSSLRLPPGVSPLSVLHTIYAIRHRSRRLISITLWCNVMSARLARTFVPCSASPRVSHLAWPPLWCSGVTQCVHPLARFPDPYTGSVHHANTGIHPLVAATTVWYINGRLEGYNNVFGACTN